MTDVNFKKISYTVSNCQSGILYPCKPDLFRVLYTRVFSAFICTKLFSNVQTFSENTQYAPDKPNVTFAEMYLPILLDLFPPYLF